MTSTPPPPEEIRFEAPDGRPLEGRIFRTQRQDPAAAVAVLGAMAVGQGFYEPFARFLGERGFSALTFDYRGIGRSGGQDDGDGREMRMLDWGRRDVEAALALAREELPGERLLVVGHSCGGQLLGLAPTSERVDAAIFVTAGIPFWRHWPRPHRWAVWALWRLLLPTLCAGGRDTVPARRLGLSGVDVPCGVALEWARWGRSERYLFDPEHGLDVSRYMSLELPIRSYAFADDVYSPPSTVAALLDEYEAADVELRRVAPEDAGMERIGHFGFFRERSRGSLWREAASWLA